MRTHWKRELVLAATVALFGLGTQVAGAAASKMSAQRRLGDERVYAVTLRGTAHVDYALMAAGVARAVGEARPQTRQTTSVQTLRYDLSATLHTRVIQVDSSGSLLAARLQAVDYRVDGTADARQALFETPFTLRQDRSGKLTSFEFPDRFPEELQQAIQRLVEPLQVVGVQPGAKAWTVDETDSDASYTARYQVREAAPGARSMTLSKSKIAMVPQALVRADLPLPGRPVTRVVRSEASIVYDPADQVIERFHSSESVVNHWGKAFFSDHDQVYDARLVQQSLATLARSVAEAEAALHDPAFARARLYDVDLQSRRQIEGVRLPEMMTLYRQTVATKAGLGAHLLGSWLRLNPAHSGEIARQIDALDPRADAEAFDFGWAALARAGHPEAQAALLRAATQPDWKQASRGKALIAMMSLEAPEPSLIQGVWEERSRLAADGRAAGRRLSIATNVFGALGDIEHGNAAQTERVVRDLAGLLARPDARSRVLALNALSNVGDFERVAPLAAPHLTSSDVRVRVAAFSTFRRMPGEQAFEKFAEAFARETQPEVRRAAAGVAYQMARSRARNEWARTLVRQESDPRVQSELVQILGRGLQAFPENAATLQDLLKITHVRSVRRDIYAFVAPVAEGGAR